MDGCGRIIAEFGTQLLVTLRWHKRIQEGKRGVGGWGGGERLVIQARLQSRQANFGSTLPSQKQWCNMALPDRT